jgi:hypothetical protein
MSSRKRRGEMTKAELDRERRMSKRGNYLRKTGKRLRCYPWEADEARAIIRAYQARGMSWDLISRSTDTSQSTLANLLSGRHATLKRETYLKVLASKYIEPHGRSAARLDATGMMRRLQALWASGWPTVFLAAELGMKRSNFVTLMMSRGTVTYPVHQQVVMLYDKLAYADPTDHGITRWAVATSKAWARQKQCVPVSCWDEDTIDNPFCAPEFTGQCGTPNGYRIHLREEIPVCHECHMAYTIHRKYPHLAELMGIIQLGIDATKARSAKERGK